MYFGAIEIILKIWTWHVYYSRKWNSWLDASVVKVVGSNPAAGHWLFGLRATGVLRPTYKLREKLALYMAALPFKYSCFSVYSQRQTCDFNQLLTLQRLFYSMSKWIWSSVICLTAVLSAPFQGLGNSYSQIINTCHSSGCNGTYLQPILMLFSG